MASTPFALFVLAIILFWSVPSLSQTQQTGVIGIFDYNTDALIGYIEASEAEAVVTAINSASTFSFDSSSSPFSITIVSPPISDGNNLLGGVSTIDISATGSYAFPFSGVAYAAPGTTESESTIWSIDPSTGELSAVWTAQDSSTVQGQFIEAVSVGDVVGLSGNADNYIATYTQAGGVRVKLIFNPPTGSISGDPHFVGFKGEKYNIIGENNKWFNLITTKDFQMNALFQMVCEGKNDLTAMTSLALNLNGNRLLLDTKGAQLDGKELQTAPRTRPYQTSNGKIVHPWENYFEVQTNEFSLVLVRHIVDHAAQKNGSVYDGKNCLDGYFNIKITDKNITSPIHGLLGQTAHHYHNIMVDNKDKEGKGEIEGSYKDYIVGGPFENNFIFNLYKQN